MTDVRYVPEGGKQKKKTYFCLTRNEVRQVVNGWKCNLQLAMKHDRSLPPLSFSGTIERQIIRFFFFSFLWDNKR